MIMQEKNNNKLYDNARKNNSKLCHYWLLA